MHQNKLTIHQYRDNKINPYVFPQKKVFGKKSVQTNKNSKI